MEMTLQTGLTGAARAVVDETNTAQALGSGTVPVYATPALVALLEQAAVDALAPHLPAGTTTVGIDIHVRHLAATPLGMAIRAEATVTGVDGRRLSFELAAYDAVEQIADGVHERVIVDEQRFIARAQAKASR